MSSVVGIAPFFAVGTAEVTAIRRGVTRMGLGSSGEGKKRGWG